MTIDIDSLRAQREEATIDKSDLFDFYNRTWTKLLDEVERLRTDLFLLCAFVVNDVNAVARANAIKLNDKHRLGISLPEVP